MQPEEVPSSDMNFSDRNAVERFLEGKKFRHCANLQCSPVELEHQVLYMPMCMEGRFKRKGFAEVLDLPQPPRPLSPVTYTTIPLWAPLISCPADCKGYRNRTFAKVQDAASSLLRKLFRKSKIEHSGTTATKKEWFEKWWGQALLLTVTGVIAGLILWGLIGYFEKHLSPASAVHNETTAANSPKGRIRLLNYQAIPATKNPAGFPAVTIYYDNAGTDVITGIVTRFGAGFGNGLLSDEAVLAEQDKLLRWDGWAQEMARKKQNELRPNDSPEFTTVPNMEGDLAMQFRKNFGDVNKGRKVLYIFLTFKFFDQTGRVGVTETCSYFSLTFARHICGRGQTFYETVPK